MPGRGMRSRFPESGDRKKDFPPDDSATCWLACDVKAGCILCSFVQRKRCPFPLLITTRLNHYWLPLLAGVIHCSLIACVQAAPP